jgi:hypothetical protein
LVKATNTVPPGFVTRTISASIAGQSPTCSSTLDDMQTSIEPEASGRRRALPATLPLSGRPSAVISPQSASTQNDRAPARRSSVTKKPGPPPTSTTTRPASCVYWLSWATVSIASSV